MTITIRQARAIIKGALARGAEGAMKPLSVVVLDGGGHVLAFERSDGASPGRFDVARGKAYGCLMLGLGGDAIQKRAETQPTFTDAMNGLFDGRFVPVRGGVLVRNAKGAVLGAVGVSGDTSDNDALAAVAGIEAAKLLAEG